MLFTIVIRVQYFSSDNNLERITLQMDFFFNITEVW